MHTLWDKPKQLQYCKVRRWTSALSCLKSVFDGMLLFIGTDKTHYVNVIILLNTKLLIACLKSCDKRSKAV
eukprot:m.252833 g.252833  ORF g.252833 m.252833 type:complete len:71 (-) comp15476_c0_seq8:86-298(-)